MEKVQRTYHACHKTLITTSRTYIAARTKIKVIPDIVQTNNTTNKTPVHILYNTCLRNGALSLFHILHNPAHFSLFKRQTHPSKITLSHPERSRYLRRGETIVLKITWNAKHCKNGLEPSVRQKPEKERLWYMNCQQNNYSRQALANCVMRKDKRLENFIK